MKFSESTENRIRPENRYLHGIRMVTNCLLTGQIAAFAGLLTGTSPVRILSACAVLAAFTLAADRIQHRIRAFGRYSIRMLTAAGVSCLLLLFLNRALFPVHASLIALFMLSFYMGRIRQKRVFYPEIHMLVYPAVIYIAGRIVPSPALQILGISCEILLVLLYLLFRNQVSLDYTLMIAENYARVPFGRITRMNNTILAVYLLFSMGLAVLLSFMIDGEPVLFDILSWVFAFCAWLMLLLFSFLARLLPDLNLPAYGSGGQLLFNLAEDDRLPAWLRTMRTIFYFACRAVCLVLLAVLIYRVLRGLYFDFRAADPETGDSRRHLEPEEKKLKNRGKTIRPAWLDFSTAGRIRRRYLSFLLLHPEHKKIRASQTPEEVLETISGLRLDQSGQLRKIHRIYEKARYAPEEVKAQDLQMMKDSIREYRFESR